MTNPNSINVALEQFQEQLLTLQQMYYPTIIDQINSIDLKQIFGPCEETLLKLVQSNISLALTQWAEQMDRIAQALQPQISHIVLSSVEFANKLDDILPYLHEELAEVKELNYKDFSEDEIKEFDNITNTVNQISGITKNNKLTIGDLAGIISIILTIVFRIFPEGPSQEIIKPLNSLVSIISDYTQQSLTNQELSLEKQDIQIENQEKMFELLEKNQCDCKKPD